MTFDNYHNFLSTQDRNITKNNDIKALLSEANVLYNNAKTVNSLLTAFPLLDNQLSSETNACNTNANKIKSLLGDFQPNDLQNLVHEIEILDKSRTKDTNTRVSVLINEIHENTNIRNIQQQIILARDGRGAVSIYQKNILQKINELDAASEKLQDFEHSLAIAYQEDITIIKRKFEAFLSVDMMEQSLRQADEVIENIQGHIDLFVKIEELNRCVNQSAVLGMVSPTDDMKKTAKKIAQQTLIPLKKEYSTAIISNINNIIQTINYDIEERANKLMKKIGIGLGITVLVALILMNIDVIISLIVAIFTGIAYIIGGILVLWIIIKILARD